MAKEKYVWTSESVFKLLKEVETKPCVWKKSDPRYMNKQVKTVAYKGIGAAIGISADECRDKLRNLRTIFMQNHRKKSKSRWGAVHQPKWEFYKAMLFMNEETTAASDTDLLYFGDATAEETKDDESNGSTFTISAVKSLSTPQTLKRHKLGDDDLASTLRSPLYEELAKSREYISKTKCPNEKFAVELVSVLNNIRHENIVKRAKARIQLILADSMAESARRDLAESYASSRTQSPIPEFSQIWSSSQGPLPVQPMPHKMEKQDDQ